ncbi:MAG: type II toxin-antitoxin system Phd/YefM family antitoxin [Isosphaeraceae bacterium]|nr:type II toxin-antitoxin system Phd/YefM family antitoxin [Isosphaeraceae bacterium]
MTTIPIEEIQRDPLGHLRKVEEGEILIVLWGDRLVAEIRPVPTGPRMPRPSGLCAGEFSVPEDFGAPLPDDLLRQFEGP